MRGGEQVKKLQLEYAVLERKKNNKTKQNKKNVHTEKRTKIKQSKIMARVHLKESEQYIQQYAQNYVRQTIIKQQRLNMKKKKKQAK